MSAQHHSVPLSHTDRDLYVGERVLNSAIIAADIGCGWEEYLEIFDAFYADDVEVTKDIETGPIRARDRVLALLFNFLAPLHVMAEIGGLSIQIRESPIHGDAADETHSAWSVNLIAVSGRVCILNWCTFRRWANSRVVYERHYDLQQSGGPLTADDLGLNDSLATLGYGRPS
jgi:hypothetical protein